MRATGWSAWGCCRLAALAATMTALGCASSGAGAQGLDGAQGGPPAVDAARRDDAGPPSTGRQDSGAVDAAAMDGATPSDAGDGPDAQANDGGGGAVYPQPGMPPGPGTLPPLVDRTAYLGTLIYDNPNIARDLGF